MSVTYFAYGSNLCLRRFRRRVPSAQVRGPARLPGFQLRWHKRSNVDGSGKCSILRTDDVRDDVHGVLYSFAPTDEAGLDRAEGLESGYAKHRIVVETAGGATPAMTYIAQPSHVDDALRPVSWYRDLVVHGARHHGLPAAWVKRLADVQADPDPDAGRVALHRRDLPCGEMDGEPPVLLPPSLDVE